MGPYVDSVTSDERMPAANQRRRHRRRHHRHLCGAVAGGRGIPVVLCEKAYIACEQSSRNWGWCRQTGRDEREMPLIVESLRLWREMDRLTESDTGFRECGVMYVGESEADEQRFQTWLDMARPFDIGTRMVRGAELARLMPGAAVHLPVRTARAHRWLRGAAEGGAGHRAGRAAQGRGHPHSLRRARHRAQAGPRQRP